MVLKDTEKIKKYLSFVDKVELPKRVAFYHSLGIVFESK
jgi:hypothetical protein